MADRRRARLDQPVEARRVTFRPEYDPEMFGRFAEQFARFLGTAKFIVYMTFFIVVWLVWNVAAPRHLQFDSYHSHFTLLTLILSVQASYAAPLILLAQNRQADRDRVQAEGDRAQNDRSIADTEYLTREVAAIRISLGEVATRDFIRSELARIAEDAERRRQEERPDAREGAAPVDPR